MRPLLRRNGSNGAAPLPELEFKRPIFEPLGDRGVKRKIEEARKLGREHGRIGVPGPDHDRAFAVGSYKDDAEHLLEQIARDWHEINRVLRGEWCRLRRLLEDRDKQLPAARTAVKKAEKRADEKQAIYDARLQAANDAAPWTRHRIGRLAYILGMIAVFLVDVPLNAVVFQIFGENQLATWALAALLGILVVPAAHVLGIQLRNRFPDRIATAGAVILPLILIVAIAVLRTTYLQENDVNIGGPLGVLLFLAFNLAVFGAAVFLSYLRHDPHEQAIEEAREEWKRAVEELEAEKKRLTQMENHVAAIRGRIAEIRVWGEEEHEKAKNWASAERNFFEKLMQEYRMANQAARERPQDVIRALEAVDKPSTPSDLRADTDLHWNCDETAAAVQRVRPA